MALGNVRGIPRPEILEFTARILDDADIEIIWIDEMLHRNAVSLIQQRADKTYSLCDAASFVLVREQVVTKALITDKHFEQEGFVRLLK